jgi:hypothetical protein
METPAVINPRNDPLEKDEEVEVMKTEQIVLERLPLPEQLANRSEEEIAQLEKRLVRKLDCYMLPAVFILFLLNILDRYVDTVMCRSHVLTRSETTSPTPRLRVFQKT